MQYGYGYVVSPLAVTISIIIIKLLLLSTV